MTSGDRYIGPHPGAFLSERQSQRAECLRLALALTSGRSVPIATVAALARWLYDGSDT